MRKTIIAVAVVLGAVLAAPAVYATEATPGPLVWADCDNLKNWYVNDPDELDRKPTPTAGGLEFKGNDLIHRETTGLNTKDLKPGTFVANPAPDQTSFFSVEVSNGPGTGTYATLRFNTTTEKWEMTTGGQFYTDADPDKLVDLPPAKKSHTVISFGVGYTNSPPGTVTTVVKSVSFRGVTYDLTCKPKPEPTKTSASPSPSVSTSSIASASPSVSVSASVSVSPSTSGSVSPSASVSSSPGAVVTTVPAAGGGSNSGGGLPVTGPSMGIAVGAGVALLAAGAVLLVMVRRRRTRFTV